MVYLIIGVALLVIIAPIMAVLPSKKDKARMAKRRKAMALGVGVEMTSIEDPDPDPKKYRSSTGKPIERRLSVAAYRFPRKSEQKDDIEWLATRFKNRSSTEICENWHFQVEPNLHSVGQFLKDNIPTLPSDSVKVEEKNRFISVYWHEDGEVSEVIDFLERCSKS